MIGSSTPDDKLAELADYYRSYATESFGSFEPHYLRICHEIADRTDVLEFIAARPAEAHQPNVILATIRYLLFQDPSHPLDAVYRGDSDEDPGPLFCDLVMKRQDEVAAVMKTRRTQTNEIGRSAPLALGLAEIYRRTSLPLAWIDLGCSAGLNLQLDRLAIRYRFGDEVETTGSSDAALAIECEIVGGRPAIEAQAPPITWRLGIDRSPIDPSNHHDARWLRACLFPSRAERAARLDAALELARANPNELQMSDAATGLSAAIDDAPAHAALVVTTTWVWYYLPSATRQEVLRTMSTAQRTIYWLSIEGAGVIDGADPDGAPAIGPATEASALALHTFDAPGGNVAIDQLAWTHPHGTWVDWRSN